MKSRLLLNIALLAGLLGLALYAYFRPSDEIVPDIRITQLTRDQVERVVVERNGAPDTEILKRNGVWRMVRPYQTRVMQIQMDRLLDLSSATSTEQFALDNLSDYGLEPANLRVTLNNESFTFGNINEITNEQYLGSDDEIFLVRTYFGYGIPVNALKLIDRKLLGEDEIPVAFDFGDWQAVKSDGGAWTVQGTQLADREQPSADTLNQWIAEWRHASSLAVSPNDAAPVDVEQVVVNFSNGGSTTFRILSREPEAVFLRVEENMRYELGREAGGRLLDPYRVGQS